MRRPILVLAVLLLSSLFTFAQDKPPGDPAKREVQLGRGMSLIAPGLMQVGLETNFFLRIADQIQLTEKQQSTLAEIAYEVQKYSVQRLADLDVADAELQRLLTRDNIDLDAVRAKVREAEEIETGVKIQRVEALLKAINTLTHEQHLKIVALSREASAPRLRPPAEPIYQ